MGSSKARSMINQGKKPGKLMWTQAWRRLNKKGKDEGIARKRTRKAARVERAVAGMSVEENLEMGAYLRDDKNHS